MITFSLEEIKENKINSWLNKRAYIGDASTQDTDRDRYSLKDQRPKNKVSNNLLWLSDLVSRFDIYTPIILSNPLVVIDVI